jgi:hypothetical protein
MRIEFESTVTRWDARADSSWYFATVPEELSADVRELPSPPRGFGSLRVRARIGASSWTTSIFPSGDAFVLPLKRAIREAEKIDEGGLITVELDIVDL